MNKFKIYIFIMFGISILSFSCKEKVEIQLEAESIYLVAYHFGMPDYAEYKKTGKWESPFWVEGYVQINKDFSSEYVRKESYKGNYYHLSPLYSDSTKLTINKMITNHPFDTIYENLNPTPYSGSSYAFVVNKGNNNIVLACENPSAFPPDLKVIMNLIYKNLDDTDKGRVIHNQDSIKKLTQQFKKYLREPSLPLPPPLKNEINMFK